MPSYSAVLAYLYASAPPKEKLNADASIPCSLANFALAKACAAPTEEANGFKE